MSHDDYEALHTEILTSIPSSECQGQPLPACCWCLADGNDWWLTDQDKDGHVGFFTMDDTERRMFCLFCLEAEQ